MKTPDEIKKGLECCADLQGYDADCLNCPYTGEQWCGDKSKADALSYIQQLEAELEAVKRERDAAVRDMTYATRCESCKHYCVDIGGFPCNKCTVVHNGAGIMWEWRGVKENGGTIDD